ncbi:unnamed protein product [Auanema sp. JU1783]|nr:unnamed protein product [Auanema sp. JU1783]
MHENEASTSSPVVEDMQTVEDLMEEMQTKFWIIFIIYVCCSAIWVSYCIITHRRDVERQEEQGRHNNVARFLELQRLMDVYNRGDVENGTAPKAQI